MLICKKSFKFSSCISFFLLICSGGFIQFNFISADTNTPLPLFHHDMVYDTQNNQMILFGGEISEGTPADYETTWLFRSQNLSWIKLSGENSPGGRSNHQMIYNSLTGKVLLFGGISKATSAQVNDTWEFDPATNQWTELHPVTAPSPRAAHEMYYDPDYNEVILYAGVNSPVSTCGDMWIYNFTANNWYEIYPSNSPGIGYGQSFVYDEMKKVGVLFGGRFGDMTLKNDIWFFNRSSISWIKKEPTIKPMERYHLAMVYNPNDNTFIMFGGDNEYVPSRSLGDTWIYDPHSNIWTEIETNLNPPACCKHDMIFDKYLNRAILFGGVGEGFSVAYNELWFYDPSTMTWSRDATATVPTYLWIVLLSFISISIIPHLMKSKISIT